jgi:hypothetical protein
MNRDKQKELFIELINKQLEPFNKKYEDVLNEKDWYRTYKTTPEKEKEFAIYAKERIMKVLNLNAKMAENEVSWFILQWGLSYEPGSYSTGNLNLFEKTNSTKSKSMKKNPN